MRGNSLLQTRARVRVFQKVQGPCAENWDINDEDDSRWPHNLRVSRANIPHLEKVYANLRRQFKRLAKIVGEITFNPKSATRNDETIVRCNQNISPHVVSVPQCTRWSKCSVAIFDQVLQVDLCTFMCHAESHIVSSTSNWCSFACSRKFREARVWNSPQLVGWGRVGICDQRCGWSRWKQGAGHSAPSRRAWFDGALRRVYMATRRGRINGCVGAWRVLPRRKRGPRPRTPVHKAPLRPRLALPGMARGSRWGTASYLGWLRRGRAHTKRQARRHKGRGRAKRTNNSGRTRGSAFVSSYQPSGSRSRRVGRKSSGPPCRRIRYQATNRRWRGSHKEPDSTRSPGEKQRLRRRLASVKEYQGIREELGCGQSARHKMLMTVAERTMQQEMLLEARKSKRRKHNKKSTRKRRTASSSASWTGSGVTSDTESEDLGSSQAAA